ncbi:response regulator transcription factor [Aurantivibrio plasticivorans]
MKVLIIEDNRDIAANIADYLEPRGFVLDFAQDGESGLRLASNEQFDAIVLDLMLPKMDGISVCDRLRSHAHVSTPVIMLTARDQLDDKLEGFSVGADDYLVKPFSVKELEARLIALAKRSQAIGHGDKLEVADLLYDLNTKVVSRAGAVIELNPILRKLLKLLMLNSHRVVTRAELEDEIWGDSPPDKDILRTHIYNLRTAIDKPFSEKLIHTIHGEGYRLTQQVDLL